jgi:hypothetical protein
MKENKLPKDLQVRLRTYFFESQRLLRDRAHNKTVKMLPPALCHEVMALTSVRWMSKIALFRLCPEDEREPIMVQLSLAMQCRAYTAGDCLFRVGQLADKMVIIQKGVCVKVRNETALTLLKGSVVGSEMIVCSPSRTIDYKVQVITFVMVHNLHRRAVQGIINAPCFEGSRRALRKKLLRDMMAQDFRRHAHAYRRMFGTRRVG